jgi:hypothetical protein
MVGKQNGNFHFPGTGREGHLPQPFFGGELPLYSFWESWFYIGFARIRQWKEEHRSGIRVGMITLYRWEEIKQVGVFKRTKRLYRYSGEPKRHAARGARVAFAVGCRDSVAVCKGRASALGKAVFKKEAEVVAAVYDRRGLARIGTHR